ncbi:MAG: hypothetical protein D6744_15315 [Planctomycetota bacterium]|nr:MAG: hypothetical protein D6744_15315 [Planctomycetota bacterium]
MTRLEPTGALITDVTTGGYGYRDREWRELQRRALSESQRERLAKGLLDRRRRSGSFDRQGSTWLRTRVLAGQMPPELVDRYYREGFRLEIVPPEPIEVGRDVTLTIRGRLAYDPGVAGLVESVFTLEAVYVDDEFVATDFRDGLVQYAGLLDLPQYEIHAAWKPRRAGPHTVRVAGWYAIGRSLVVETAHTWRVGDHRPMLPPRKIEGMHRVEAAITVNVEP